MHEIQAPKMHGLERSHKDIFIKGRSRLVSPGCKVRPCLISFSTSFSLYLCMLTLIIFIHAYFGNGFLCARKYGLALLTNFDLLVLLSKKKVNRLLHVEPPNGGFLDQICMKFLVFFFSSSPGCKY